MKEINKTYPMVIVFYLDAELMKNKRIIQPFVESVNQMISDKEANVMAFFLPTADGSPERLDCINPMVLKEPDMENVNKMIEDIKKNFSVGVDVGHKDTDITPDKKECTCDKTDGSCNCQ